MFLGMRELLYSKLRYFLVTGIMVLIILLALILSGLANGLAYDNASSIANNNVPLYAISKDAQGTLARSLFNEKALDTIKKDSNVKDAALFGQSMQTLKRESDDKKYSVALFGIQPDSFLAPKIASGHSLKVTKPDEIVVDSSLKKEGLHIGDVLMDDILNRELTIVGFTTDQKYSHAPVAYLNIATWHMTLQKTAQFGILKALGVKTKRLAGSIIGQVVVISLIAIIISVLVTFLLPLILPDAMPFRLDTVTIISYSVLFFVVAIIGSLLSLYRIAKIDPLDAIRGGDE